MAARDIPHGLEGYLPNRLGGYPYAPNLRRCPKFEGELPSSSLLPKCIGYLKRLVCGCMCIHVMSCVDVPTYNTCVFTVLSWLDVQVVSAIALAIVVQFAQSF